jgi:hypothetical protein
MPVPGMPAGALPATLAATYLDMRSQEVTKRLAHAPTVRAPRSTNVIVAFKDGESHHLMRDLSLNTDGLQFI